jgi:ketosteroid isomerase-like protein
MSENLDLVRSIYADWERGDWSLVSWADPEMELVFGDGPVRGSWKGLAAVRDGWREFLSSWEDWRIAVEEYRELDEERVLVLVRNSGRGKASGVDVKQIAPQTVNVFHIRDGKVTRLLAYAEVDRAFADLGPAE